VQPHCRLMSPFYRTSVNTSWCWKTRLWLQGSFISTENWHSTCAGECSYQFWFFYVFFVFKLWAVWDRWTDIRTD